MPRRLDGPVLACDLDETLVRVNTFPLFVRFTGRQLLAQRDYPALVRLALAVAARRLFGGSHVRFKAEVHALGRRLDGAAVDTWATGVFRAHVNADVLQRVAEWRGHTVLVTAAPRIYAERIGALADVTLVQASDFGDAGYDENVHARKARRLQDVLTDRLDCAITDDVRLDGPLLEMAGRPLVVDSNGTIQDLGAPGGGARPESPSALP
ncbi:UNVERIFIED_ORG: haloacid dehalogenase-like hydrolase [Bacillus sp. AZ43]